jgi:hypothetical protein
LNHWQVYDSGNEPLRVATPSAPTSDGTTAIGADCPIVASYNEPASSVGNILEGISTVGGEFQHASVVAEVRILARRFEIKVVSKS